jgi:ATP-binding cassette subfamily C (CFTR/MRP) protein 4
MFFLQNISFSVDENELLGIIGTVGSGKTTLLLAMLNEISNKKGDISISGRVFYVTQEPWIYSATIKDNIIFGKEYNKEKFAKILEVCSLNEVRRMSSNWTWERPWSDLISTIKRT